MEPEIDVTNSVLHCFYNKYNYFSLLFMLKVKCYRGILCFSKIHLNNWPFFLQNLFYSRLLIPFFFPYGVKLLITEIYSVLGTFVTTGMISSLNFPAAVAAAARL